MSLQKDYLGRPITYNTTIWPCQVIHGWKPLPTDEGCLEISAGQNGWQLSESSNGWCKISLGSSEKTGWVPKDRIQRGSVEMGTPIKVNYLINTPNLSSIVAPPTQILVSPLSKALYGLLQGLQLATRQTSSLNNASDEVLGIFRSNRELQLFMQSFEQGVSPRFLQFLQLRGQMTFHDLERCEQVSQESALQGIYARCYRLPDGNYHVYIGSSIEMFVRQKGHERCVTSGTKGKHYDIARQASSSRVIVLASVPTKKYLALTEQIFILLFGSYFQYMIKPPTDLDNPFWTDLIWQSTVLWRIASDSFKLSGWERLTKTLGASGLNTLSPIICNATEARTIWSRVVNNDAGVTEFRRPPLVVVHGNGEGSIGLFKSLHPSVPYKSLPDLDLGDQVSIAVELMSNGHPHPAPYAPLPLIGKYTDWLDTSYLAIRIEWRAPSSPTGWYATYLQRTVRGKKSKEGMQHGPFSYRMASMLVAALRRQKFEPQSAWRQEIPDLRIFDISFNHLDRAYNVQELIEREIIPEPVERDLNGVRRDLIGLGFNVAAKPPPGVMQKNRNKCDFCFLASAFPTKEGGEKRGWLRDVKCHPVELGLGTDRCDLCQNYGLLCTFTRSDILRNHPYKDAIFEPRIVRKYFAVPEPKWYTMGQELSASQDEGEGVDLGDLEAEIAEYEGTFVQADSTFQRKLIFLDEDESRAEGGGTQFEEMDVDLEEEEEEEEGERQVEGTEIELGTPVSESEEESDWEFSDVLPRRRPKIISPEL
ncbi:MAG: hypothetical protein Q9198_005851 [Flavoplaca austrocitrina]